MLRSPMPAPPAVPPAPEPDVLNLASWRLTPVKLPYQRVVRWSDTVEDGGTYLLLELLSSCGHNGLAEGTVKSMWTGTTLASQIACLTDILLPRLTQVNLRDPAAINAALAMVPENRAAKALIDQACWDLRADAAGLPLWGLMGGTQEVAVSWTLTRGTPLEMAHEAAAMVDRYGFRTLKLKGGQGEETDLRAVQELRGAVGDLEIYVDANWHYDYVRAIAYANRLAEYGVRFVEDPYMPVPDGRFRAAQAGVIATLLVDYPCVETRDVEAFLAVGARMFSVKPGRIGPRAAFELAQRAASGGAGVVVGLFAESALGSIAALSVSGALETHTGQAAALPAEVTFFLTLKDQLLQVPLDIHDGCAFLPSKSNHHLIDPAKLARYTCC